MARGVREVSAGDRRDLAVNRNRTDAGSCVDEGGERALDEVFARFCIVK